PYEFTPLSSIAPAQTNPDPQDPTSPHPHQISRKNLSANHAILLISGNPPFQAPHRHPRSRTPAHKTPRRTNPTIRHPPKLRLRLRHNHKIRKTSLRPLAPKILLVRSRSKKSHNSITGPRKLKRWRLHFIDQKCKLPTTAKNEGSIPILLIHGWPGSFYEFRDVIKPLNGAGFDCVVPSLPGFCWSSAPKCKKLECERYGEDF
ncbi:uncharacterized protein MYCFIDRAFT_202647, partial [Pseudocercospora fijiensis CIRAD86]